MGLFSSIFGGGKKIDYGSMIPDPPKFSLQPGSLDQYTSGIQNLLDVFGKRASGEDQFDYLKYVYGPQETALNQQYGINTNPGDVYSQRTGVLPQTLASLNKRGLLDTGTSGVIEGQLRSNLANKLGELFGQAKQNQRSDIDAALENLHGLYPELFQAKNIQSQIDYDNANNAYNALINRNMATVNQQQQRSANKANIFNQGLGLLTSAFTGGFSPTGFSASGALEGINNAINPYAANPYEKYLKDFFPRRSSVPTSNYLEDPGYARMPSGAYATGGR